VCKSPLRRLCRDEQLVGAWRAARSGGRRVSRSHQGDDKVHGQGQAEKSDDEVAVSDALNDQVNDRVLVVHQRRGRLTAPRCLDDALDCLGRCRAGLGR
jgi:hypothetical protein